MKKRKITKFRPLCPSDISPYKGATKQEVPPLYKGRLGGVCAFTLVELIVVVSILAILGTISFIAFQGFAIEARDAKRITDVKGLIDKVNIEQVKGVPLSSLITEEETHSTKINGQSNNNGTYQGIINFETIREDPKNFQDPLTKINYPFAYAEGTTQVNGVNQLYKFMQIATINERNGTTQLVGNYFKYDEQDDESLFVDENGDVMENGEPPMIYEPNNNAQNKTETLPSSSSGGEIIVNGECGTANNTNLAEQPSQTAVCANGTLANMNGNGPWTWDCNGENGGTDAINCKTNATVSCANQPNYAHAIFTPGTPTSTNQVWQNENISSPCYYTCDTGYTWDGDSCEQVVSVTCGGINKGGGNYEIAGHIWKQPSTTNLPEGCVLNGNNVECYWANSNCWTEREAPSNNSTYYPFLIASANLPNKNWWRQYDLYGYNIPYVNGEYVFRCGGKTEYENIDNYPAFKACDNLGDGRRLPNAVELTETVPYLCLNTDHPTAWLSLYTYLELFTATEGYTKQGNYIYNPSSDNAIILVGVALSPTEGELEHVNYCDTSYRNISCAAGNNKSSQSRVVCIYDKS